MEKVRRKKMQVREKVGKSRFTVFSNDLWLPSLKRRVPSQLARWEMKNCTPLWREAHFQVKMYKARQHRTTFGSWDVEKGAKHISKSKCTKHTVLSPLLEVEMSKKCTPLWREAHFQVKMYKTHHSQPHLEVEMSKKVHPVVARSKFPSQNVQSTTCSDHFLTSRCRKSARRCGAKHISKLKVWKTDGFEPFLTLRCRKKWTLTNTFK